MRERKEELAKILAEACNPKDSLAEHRTINLSIFG
jgi:hypothetical protein